VNLTRFFKGVFGTQFGSLESEKIIIGFLKSEKIGFLQIHTGYGYHTGLTLSLKKTLI